MVEPSYSPEASGASYRIGAWTLCTRTNRLVQADVQVELESRLVYLLIAFADHRGEVLPKDWLLKTVWAGRTVTDESLTVAISQVRKALGDDPRAPSYIKTVPGKGYQLVAEAGRIEAPALRSQEPWARWPVRWGIVLPIAALALVGVGFAVQSTQPKSKIAFYADIEARLDTGDPARQREVVRDLHALAAREPSAEAFARLADAKIRLLGDALVEPDNCREVIGLLDKAISMEPRHNWAYKRRADGRFLCRHDMAGAEADYRTARRVSPRHDYTALGYSGFLLAQGRFDESLAQIKDARRLNPLHYSGTMAVWLYQMHGRDDLALHELRRIESGGAGDKAFHVSALRLYTRAGRDAEAFAHLEWLMRAQGYGDADVASARAALTAGGMKAVFGWLLARKETKDLGHYTPPLSWARYALEAGRTDEAMIHLEQAFAQNQIPLLWANVDPAYAGVRDDPRFQAWAANMKTPVD
ncbi:MULTISPECIES: winged helix-turn-helix domain-containing protein [Asticcacaulis]|uniref:winged helix-turn-helix domain-containing protein n=1 Tax=Asticcacaulis TaxID=76890 RepID=UPI001AEA1FAD|nr:MULTISPECIES: winged helix-turn-helix domain-containing protein [Asticcacaulis]MBP2158734.1 DNA-binding winged helix-turn-helix (wHTH) protein [Asticcacaulis solisilvae]MDR6799780.1 DNA-binding winged helix-turn-helix (wHTH) protein [Asticcacaulis sp. BE141]